MSPETRRFSACVTANKLRDDGIQSRGLDLENGSVRHQGRKARERVNWGNGPNANSLERGE